MNTLTFPFFVSILLMNSLAFAISSTTEDAQKRGELQVRGITEAVLGKHCGEQCKIIGIDVEVDVAVDDQVAPGFEDAPSARLALAPAAAKIRLLIDEALGKVSTQKVTDLLKKQLAGLNYPVTLEQETLRFPQPASAAYKSVELRDRVTRQFKEQVTSILNQFCPEACTLGEFDVSADTVNAEEAQYGSNTEYFQDGGAAIRVRGVKATILMDETLPTDEMNSLLEMARMKTNFIKNVEINGKMMKFPRPTVIAKRSLPEIERIASEEWGYGRGGVRKDSKLESSSKQESLSSNEQKNSIESKQNSKTSSSEDSRANSKTNTTSRTTDANESKYSRFEKIERVESGDAVQSLLSEYSRYAVIFGAVILALLMTLVALAFRRQGTFWPNSSHARGEVRDLEQSLGHQGSSSLSSDERAQIVGMRMEADRLQDELMATFSEQPKVAKYVFGQVLTEEGIEVTAQYITFFGESIVLDLLRDPTLQGDLTELMDFYARNTFDINEEERLNLLRRLHHRCVAGKMAIHGSRSATLFDYLADMDAPQIMEMIRNESVTVKAIVLTQCDSKKRQTLFHSFDEANRMKLMAELTRIDNLPKNYIYNVAAALRRKKAENPRLNTEALPGTDVLVTFLERSSLEVQKGVIQQLLNSSAETLQNVKSKLVSVDTLRFLKDSQIVEVISGMKHDELLVFLKGCNTETREAVLIKAPQDLSVELREELQLTGPVNKEAFSQVERKFMNRIKVLASQGHVNLAEVNERMFAYELGPNSGAAPEQQEVSQMSIRRVA